MSSETRVSRTSLHSGFRSRTDTRKHESETRVSRKS